MCTYIPRSPVTYLPHIPMILTPLLSVITVAILALPIQPDRHRTTRRNLHRTDPTPNRTAEADTIVPSSGMVILSGYDKPLRSSRESIFVTNRSRRAISAITLRIVYSDTKERQLHSRDITIATHIPPGETRQLTFSSWDRQHAFYFHLTGKPRTADGSPYTVRVTPLSVVINR